MNGSRFSHGQQFPSTGSASLKREKAIRRAGPLGPLRVELELVPLTGARVPMFDVAGRWVDGLTQGASSYVVEGLDAAVDEFARLVAHYEQGGRPPE